MKMNRKLAAATIALATVAGLGTSMTAASAEELDADRAKVTYENYLTTSWGRVDHSFKPSGTHKGLLTIKLADKAADGDCVYVDATVKVTMGPNYTRRIGRVCGNGTSDTFSYTFNPVVGASIRGVDVRLCKEDAFNDTCVTEYNAR